MTILWAFFATFGLLVTLAILIYFLSIIVDGFKR